MQIDVLFQVASLGDIKQYVNDRFGQEMKVHQEKLSMYEQYQIRPVERFVAEIWKYRIVCNKGIYYFGTLKS